MPTVNENIQKLRTQIVSLTVQSSALTQQILNMQNQLDRMERDLAAARAEHNSLQQASIRTDEQAREDSRAARIHQRHTLFMVLTFTAVLSIVCSGTLLKQPEVILSAQHVVEGWISSGQPAPLPSVPSGNSNLDRLPSNEDHEVISTPDPQETPTP